MSKVEILHRGGIAIVSTPTMAYMARSTYEKLCTVVIKRKKINFQVVKYKKFSRGEILPVIQESVRLKNVYLFYDFNGDACHDSFTLQLTISALQGAGADSITLVMPFMPFLRQDRKDQSRVPISAKDFITGYERYEKVERTITLDMHAAQTQIGFDKRSDHLPGHVIFVPWIKQKFGDQIDHVIVVGPDAGSEKRVKKIAREVGCTRAFFTKDERDENNNTEVEELHGAPVKDMICILNDDIIDSGSTIIQAANALMKFGALEVHISATHAVFGGNAYTKLAKAGYLVTVTDSLITEPHEWLTVLTLGDLMGSAILQNNIENGSVSSVIEHR